MGDQQTRWGEQTKKRQNFITVDYRQIVNVYNLDLDFIRA